MTGFIELHQGRARMFVNIDAIAFVDELYERLIFIGGGAEEFNETYDEVVNMIKEKENIPPTPPIREKETNDNDKTKRARARKPFVKPTLYQVSMHVREKGYTFDPERFWNFYESKGWRVGSHVMKLWTAACVTWQKSREQKERERAHLDAKMDEIADRRTAHIDAKMDERFAKGRGGFARRKADNNVEMTDDVREEVRRDFDL